MIGQKRIPSREGGIEVAVEALAVRMAASGHDVTLYTCHRGVKNKTYFYDYKGVHIREIGVPNVKGISTITGSLIATLCAMTGKYDCIHYHAEGPAAMLLIPHFLGIKTVVTIHGLDWKRSKWGKFASWYLKQGEKIAAAYANEIIVLSQSARRYFREIYHRNVAVIPNGIDRPMRRDAEVITKQWGLIKDEYILFLGRIVPEKGLEILVKAFLQVNTNKKLVIAGAPSDTEIFFEKLKEMADADKRIIFCGFVQGIVVDELFSNSYLYCLPSDIEGMPISLLEAMSYGNCCLCSDIEECSEVLEQHGYLFKRGDAEDLRRMLQILCDQPELVEKSRLRVSDYVCQKYSWDDSVEKTLRLYQSLKK